MTQTEILWKYQEAESELDKLKKELESTPERQKLRKLRKILQEQTEKIDGYRTGLKEKETELENGLAKLEALLKEYDLEQDDLNIMMEDEECTAEELTECRKSMEDLLRRVNSLQKSLTECQKYITDTETAIKEAYSKGSKTKRDYEAAKAVVETEKSEHQPVIDKAQKNVDMIGSQLSPELLKRYKTIKKKHPNPVAGVQDNRCMGCGMSLPMTAIKKISSGTAMIECENCGRILCC
ncbi:MAG: hypothetical protein K6F68_04500 [Clostridiales bacterium]|nr:hypothetical protein [Clostridiales bacterium]